MKLKWLIGVWILLTFVLAGSVLAATVSISPARPNGNDNLLCLVSGTTTGVSAHWTSTGFSGEQVVNPLSASFTRGGDTVTCGAWVPGISGMMYVGSASATIINRAPVVSGIPNINVTEDIVYTGIDLDSYVNEPDGDAVTWTAVSNNPNIVVAFLAGNILRITPAANYTGNGTIAFRATDSLGLFGQQIITVNILPVNDPPIINLPNSITFLEDTNGSLDLDLYASDIDSAVLTFSSLGGVNITVNINPLTNIATFIPDPNYFGSENIIFTVTDGQYNRSDTILVIVIPVNDSPIVNLPVNRTVNEGQNVIFSANVSDIDTVVLNYAWDFNSDGVIDSNLVSPNYIYSNNGTYLVTLTVNDGVNFVNDTMSVYVNDLNPFVNFTFNSVNPNENQTVLFTDLSTASIYDAITGYAWDFDGDSIIDSNLQNPSFIYLQDGNYTITLTVFDEDSSASFSQNIIVNDLNPIASFIYVPLNPIEGEQVNFTDTSVSYDGISTWNWDFDNDTIIDGNLQNPNYIFVNNGSYTVVLVIQEADGDMGSFSAVINVANNAPIVDLVPSVNNGDEGLFVGFTCNVVNGNLPFNFTLDSGVNIQNLTNGASVNFNETYLNNGTYAASCLVVDADGDIAADYENITINDLDPDLFVSYPAFLNEGENGTFNASSTTGILFEWDWNYLGVFNVSDTGNNVVHAFTDNNTYTVAVRTFDGDSYNMTVFNVNVLDLNPSASLTGNLSINEGEYADFDASLSTSWPDNIIGYEWDFDYTGIFNADASGLVPFTSNQYNTSGNYVVAVRVLDEDSSSIATWNLTVIDSVPTAVLNSNITNIVEGDYVNLDGSLSTGFDTPLSYLFDFNDGNVTLSSNPIIDHQFVQNGTYNVILTVIDSDGSNSTANVVINAADTVPNNLNIVISPNPGLANQTIYFNGSANAYDQPVSYLWDFGDFVNGVNQNDTHSYAAAGNYTVVLTAIDSDGSNITGSVNLEILDALVNNAPQIFNIIPLTPVTINQSEIVNFSADVSDIDGGNLFVQWFLDGVNMQNNSYVDSGSTSFSNNFTLNGTYTVYVNVTDGFLVNATTWIVNVLPANISLPNVTLSYILINEVESNPNGTDSGNEWIEIYNPTLSSIDLTNWFVQRVDNGATVNLTPVIMGPGSYYLFNTSGIILANTNLTLVLYDNMSNAIDSTSALADAANDNNCWARVPNGVDTNTSADWTFQTCTPNAANNVVIDVTPPVVTLISPVNGFLSGINNVTVQYSVTDDMALNLNCSVYSNTTGSFAIDTTQTVANGNTSNFNYVSLADGSYLWNVLCTDGVNSVFAPANFTFIVNTLIPDTTPPSIVINSPLAQTYNMTITAADPNLQSVWFNYNGTDVYYTAPMLITFPDNSTFTLNAYANDSFGNLNSTSVTFTVNTSAPFVDTLPPVITINSPLNQSYNVSNITVDINVTDNVQVDAILFNLYFNCLRK
ncbi:PKD domain-containing protein [Candidatus Woesearchaeota archaeon]|nr:PKD domain-containing protein [Candidatus Woesearchaeota archaeon]